jgi:hypothetical protein
MTTRRGENGAHWRNDLLAEKPPSKCSRISPALKRESRRQGCWAIRSASRNHYWWGTRLAENEPLSAESARQMPQRALRGRPIHLDQCDNRPDAVDRGVDFTLTGPPQTLWSKTAQRNTALLLAFSEVISKCYPFFAECKTELVVNIANNSVNCSVFGFAPGRHRA